MLHTRRLNVPIQRIFVGQLAMARLLSRVRCDSQAHETTQRVRSKSAQGPTEMARVTESRCGCSSPEDSGAAKR